MTRVSRIASDQQSTSNQQPGPFEFTNLFVNHMVLSRDTRLCTCLTNLLISRVQWHLGNTHHQICCSVIVAHSCGKQWHPISPSQAALSCSDKQQHIFTMHSIIQWHNWMRLPASVSTSNETY